MPDLGQIASSIVDGITGFFQGMVDGMAAGLVGVLTGVVSLFPTAEPLGLSPGSGILRGYAWLNSWLPVSELLTALGLIVTVATTIFAVRVLIKVWEWLPFKFS